MSKSLIEIAYEFVASSDSPVNFNDIWEHVKKEANLSEEEANNKAGLFFTNLMLDGRFVTLGENVWDLRERHTFDKVHIDMRNVYSDVQTSDDDKEEDDEEEYNKIFEEESKEDSASDDESEDGDESSDEGTDF